jgi:hypothetical protein
MDYLIAKKLSLHDCIYLLSNLFYTSLILPKGHALEVKSLASMKQVENGLSHCQKLSLDDCMCLLPNCFIPA